MDFLFHNLEIFWEIGNAIGWTFGLIFCISLMVLIGFFAYSMQKLRKYGCKPGFARKLKSSIMESTEFSNSLCKGKVSNKDANIKLKSIFPYKNKHLLFKSLLTRFITRPIKTLERQPSLQSLSDEFAIVSSIQRSISTIRSVAAVLPAIGLCGTLIGMYRAFTGTDFNEPDIQKVMTELMKNFGTALWTTILAVIIKIWSDILCYFGPQSQVSVMTDELVQLKYYLFDILEQQSEQPQSKPTETITTKPEEVDAAHKSEEHKSVDIKPDQKKSENNS